MAKIGQGYFDAKGAFYRTAEEATASDLAALLGKVGGEESLAPGLAKVMMQKRSEIEAIWAEHDKMEFAMQAAQEERLT